MGKYIYKKIGNERFCCWGCCKEWKDGDTVRTVPSVDVPGTTDDVCNNCYSKRIENK